MQVFFKSFQYISCALLIHSIHIPSAFAMHIILDPGHGGNDKGATQGSITESQITLQISKILAEKLRNQGKFTVTLTRKSDTFISLEERASIANTTGDVFLSIHVNSSPDTKIHGSEIYFQNQLQPDEESLFLASRENKNLKLERAVVRSVSLALKDKKNINPEVQSIVEDLERNTRLKLSGVLAEQLFYNWSGDPAKKHQSIRQAPFFVVSNVEKPAALIEVGYISNTAEAERLMNPEYQEKIAEGLFKALAHFKDFVDKPDNKSLN
jgi:N-acetylmuramoyl-L-alanine amidase